jgi:HEPN domain-containing protein
MSGPSPEEGNEARRWLGEADEELTVARILADDTRAPARAACFHAHLAVEKAIKALLIERGIVVPRSHDLSGLTQLLPEDDQDRFATEDLRAIDPWTLEGRYPADLADLAADRVQSLVEAAARVVGEVHLVWKKG